MKIERKIPIGITFDSDVYQVFVEHPYLKRSAYVNNAVRQALIAEGMLEA